MFFVSADYEGVSDLWLVTCVWWRSRRRGVVVLTGKSAHWRKTRVWRPATTKTRKRAEGGVAEANGGRETGWRGGRLAGLRGKHGI